MEKKRGPTSPIIGHKQSLAEPHGIASMAIQTPVFYEPLSPRSSLLALQNQRESSIVRMIEYNAENVD